MASATLLQSSGDVLPLVCHDRYGHLGSSDFARRACSLCYVYLFPSRWPAYVALMPDYIYLTPTIGLLVTRNNATERGNDSSNESTSYEDNPEEVIID